MRYLILTLFMFFSASKYETQKYNVIVSDDDFEIRYYPKALKAKVSSTKSSNGNFYKLFKFISGNNENGDKIQMTTPVYMKNGKNKNTMEFVMPSKYDINSISNPNDKDVTIFESEAKYYACIRYGGYSNDSKFKEHSNNLSQKLKELNIETVGDFFYVSYDSPYKVFNRRNEAMIEINYEEKN